MPKQFPEFTTWTVDDLNALVRQLPHLEHVVRFRESEKRPDRRAFSDFYSDSGHVRKLSRVAPRANHLSQIPSRELSTFRVEAFQFLPLLR